ncbi:MAG: hemerythrin domain-containing protein [Minwuia sp.]|uniref:hemerythrin domain-containing protein n=1 Tax=Minwuia sp. TaxID=2493630 RepID=UPI003A85867E
MDAISIIRDEHRRMGAVLDCLRHIAQDLTRVDEVPDFAAFDAIIDYMTSFPAHYHHPKEETHLFRALQANSDRFTYALAVLRKEHEEGEARLLKLERAVEAARQDPAGKAEALLWTVNEYVDFEGAHMRREEKEILSEAAGALTEAQMADLQAAFSGNEDPLFGPTRQKKYDDLFKRVLSASPQPYGFAEPWKIRHANAAA